MGTDKSAKESYHSTVSTWGTCSTCCFRAATSFSGISFKIKKVNAPLWKSSCKMSWPTTVSMPSGRYVSMS